jgi:hypothetical protein
MPRLLIALVLLLPLTVSAESRLPFLKDKVGDRELPRPWGIGLDFYTMDQEYDIEFLQFDLPGVTLPDPSTLGVSNEVQHFDIKIDAWLLPFLNVFAVIGHVESDTVIDLSNTPITGLPVPLSSLPFASDGSVVGLGFTLAYGGDDWFTTITTTRTEADLGGAFDSNIDSTTIQPRIGLIRGQWQFWLGGLFLDTEESHTGTVDLPLGVDQNGAPILVPLPFDVLLGGADDWNVALGARHVFSPHASVTFEVGVGDRSHTLFNYTYRF